MTTLLSQCMLCVHAQPGMTCVAFPYGIPSQVADNTLDHREPVEGDQGVRFERNELAGPSHPLAPE